MVSVVVKENRKGKIITRKRARTMRAQPVATEKIFWVEVRNRKLGGFKFKRQYLIGSYIADFVCLEKKLIVELDGPFHTRRRDEKRDAYLRGCGFEIFRIKNEDLAGDMSGFLVTLKHILGGGITPSP